jgi:hypothetical protein
MIYSISSVVTKNCLKEFLLTKYSCEQFNDCKWYIYCDKYSYDILKKYDNVILNTFEIDDNFSNHNSNNKLEKETFLNIILNKFNSIETCLSKENISLFLDSDMLFTGKIEDKYFKLLENNQIDFIVSPHYTNNLLIENQYGLYNVGMFAVNDKQKIETWKHLTKDHEKLNLYYEQKPFELIMKNYFSLSLPINYNIGWWRFNQDSTKNRINQLNIVDIKSFKGSNLLIY